MKHHSALQSIYSTIYQDIDLIINSQKKSKDILSEEDAKKLIEYGKFLRTDKDDTLPDLSPEEEEELILEEAKKIRKNRRMK